MYALLTWCTPKAFAAVQNSVPIASLSPYLRRGETIREKTRRRQKTPRGSRMCVVNY